MATIGVRLSDMVGDTSSLLSSKGVMLLLLASGWGCSLAVDAARDQCSTDLDCRVRGLQFEAAVCIDNICQGDPKWSCVDAVEAQAPQEAREATLEVYDIYEQTRPVAGVHASLHTLLDYDLANPISSGDTDADGKVTLRVPDTFVGFVYLEADALIEPAIFYPDLPLPSDAGLGRALVGGPGADDGVVRLIGETPVAGRGSLFLQLKDCAGGGGGGATLRFDNNMAGSRIYYVSAGLPSAQVTQFDESGVAGVANANPGLFNINVIYDDKTVSSKSVLVRPEVLTVTTLLPGRTVLVPTGE